MWSGWVISVPGEVVRRVSGAEVRSVVGDVLSGEEVMSVVGVMVMSVLGDLVTSLVVLLHPKTSEVTSCVAES